METDTGGSPRAGEGFGRAGRVRTVVLYGGTVVVGLVLLRVVLAAGHGLHAPRPSGGGLEGMV